MSECALLALKFDRESTVMAHDSLILYLALAYNRSLNYWYKLKLQILT